MSRTIRIRSEDETLQADLYGELPARRAVVLIHGQGWDADGWSEFPSRFVARGIPALAVNLRGHDGSSGTRVAIGKLVDGKWRRPDAHPPVETWSPITDVVAATVYLREQGANEVALLGTSLGGHAVLGSGSSADVECVVSISAPVIAMPEESIRRIAARKLFVCASEDHAMPSVLQTFNVARDPKALLVFGGREHARSMFTAPYGEDAIDAIVNFVARGL